MFWEGGVHRASFGERDGLEWRETACDHLEFYTKGSMRQMINATRCEPWRQASSYLGSGLPPPTGAVRGSPTWTAGCGTIDLPPPESV